MSLFGATKARSSGVARLSTWFIVAVSVLEHSSNRVRCTDTSGKPQIYASVAGDKAVLLGFLSWALLLFLVERLNPVQRFQMCHKARLICRRVGTNGFHMGALFHPLAVGV